MSAKLLEDVLIDLCMHGADRGALVRAAGEGITPGVMVIVTSNAAGLRIFTALSGLAGKAQQKQPAPGDVLDYHDDSFAKLSLVEIFGRCDAVAVNTLFFDFRFGRMPVRGIVFTGELCAEVAEICTANGAPCSLDPKKSAPGFEIVKREKR